MALAARRFVRVPVRRRPRCLAIRKSSGQNRTSPPGGSQRFRSEQVLAARQFVRAPVSGVLLDELDGKGSGQWSSCSTKSMMACRRISASFRRYDAEPSKLSSCGFDRNPSSTVTAGTSEAFRMKWSIRADASR
jgi:hypothetical protein